MTPKYAKGGIGDLLLCLQSAKEEKKIQIYSHFINAPDIFSPFDIEVTRFDYFRSIEELNSFFIPGFPLEQHLHPKFEIPKAPFPRPNGKIVGIHIEGSRFSNEYWTKLGQPSKNMSENFLINLINEIRYCSPEIIIYIFCEPSRKDEIGLLLTSILFDNYYVISFNKIWDSLACVEHCDYVIGMDSAIKSFSAILSKPTITLVGDYSDVYRDSTFLTPYIQEGIMNIIKFKQIDLVNPKEVVQYLTK